MSDNPIPNPEYERMVKAGKGWDPFPHMANAFHRITIGPPRALDLLCPRCKKLSDVIWNGPSADGSYSTTCTECGHITNE